MSLKITLKEIKTHICYCCPHIIPTEHLATILFTNFLYTAQIIVKNLARSDFFSKMIFVGYKNLTINMWLFCVVWQSTKTTSNRIFTIQYYCICTGSGVSTKCSLYYIQNNKKTLHFKGMFSSKWWHCVEITDNVSVCK